MVLDPHKKVLRVLKTGIGVSARSVSDFLENILRISKVTLRFFGNFANSFEVCRHCQMSPFYGNGLRRDPRR